MTDSVKKSPIRENRTLGIAALALAVVLFLAVNIFSESAIKGVQVDLTENSLFTLSEGTKETLAKVKEPITLRFFSTRKLLNAFSNTIIRKWSSLWKSRRFTLSEKISEVRCQSSSWASKSIHPTLVHLRCWQRLLSASNNRTGKILPDDPAERPGFLCRPCRYR